MSAFGILVHHERAAAWAVGADLVDWLTQRGHEVRIPAVDAERIGRSEVAVPDDELVEGLDLMVGIGGDGTILRAVDAAADSDVPVLGVNAGQLGYLSVVESDGVRVAVKRFLSGDAKVQERMRLCVTRAGPEGPITATALNEVVLERFDVGHTVRIEVALDGERFTPYVGDGLIVSTPTGSTAYAFSVRGPIIAPGHKAILIAPVAPHMLFDRPLVLEPTSEVRLTVRGHRPAMLSVDGRVGEEVADGEVVVCTASPKPARLIHFGRQHFLSVLRAKFGLPER